MRKVKEEDESITRSASADVDIVDKIRARAYQIYLERGQTSGSAEDDWLKAEQEILSVQSHSAAA